jgi:hypothetical protein
MFVHSLEPNSKAKDLESSKKQLMPHAADDPTNGRVDTALSSAHAQILLRALQCFIMPFIQNGAGRRDQKGQERLLKIIAVEFDNVLH